MRYEIANRTSISNSFPDFGSGNVDVAPDDLVSRFGIETAPVEHNKLHHLFEFLEAMPTR